jgi:hypothetical protein
MAEAVLPHTEIDLLLGESRRPTQQDQYHYGQNTSEHLKTNGKNTKYIAPYRKLCTFAALSLSYEKQTIYICGSEVQTVCPEAFQGQDYRIGSQRVNRCFRGCGGHRYQELAALHHAVAEPSVRGD